MAAIEGLLEAVISVESTTGFLLTRTPVELQAVVSSSVECSDVK
jgi:hypothetical protein